MCGDCDLDGLGIAAPRYCGLDTPHPARYGSVNTARWHRREEERRGQDMRLPNGEGAIASRITSRSIVRTQKRASTARQRCFAPPSLPRAERVLLLPA